MAQLLDATAGGDPVIEKDDATVPGPEAEAAPKDIDPTEFYSGDDDDGDGSEQQDQPEGDEDDGDQPEPIAPPVSWSAEDKAEWDSLPRSVQETLARRESEREKFVQSKAMEAKQAEQRVLGEVRQKVADLHSSHAETLERYAAMFTPQPPNRELLFTGNPQDGLIYQQQDAIYRDALAQQQQLQQQIAEERARSSQLIEEQEMQELAADRGRLSEAFPDWFDAEQKLKPDVINRLEPIGKALGYPPELLAQARAVDFMALNMAAGWKEKADKYDAAMKGRMEHVRAGKKLPPAARPAAQTAVNRQSQDVVSILYPND